MFFNKSLLATAAVLIGSASAFTGTATLGFGGTTTCGCPASNGPVAVSVPLALAAGQRCCFDTVTAFTMARVSPRFTLATTTTAWARRTSSSATLLSGCSRTIPARPPS
ncbi:hypothetical protein B0H14DRAFT_2778119, partial [Mycena olivaceomarginata]